MQELLDQLTSYLRGMWHRRWIGMAVAWLAAIVGVAIVYRIPEKYEASARVYVDTESLLRPLLSGLAVQPNVEQQVSLMSRTLISRPNVEKLLRAADLDLAVKTPEARDDVIDQVMKTIRLDGNVSSNLYVISYRDPEPARARKVVQSLLAIFVESTLGDKRQDTQTAVKFLDEQIKRYEETLRSSEARLKEFRLKYLGVTTGGHGNDYFEKASQLASAIDDARLEVQSAEQSRDAYKKQLQDGTPLPQTDAEKDADTTITSPVLDARIEGLKKDLDTLLLKYTDQHPDVVSTKRLIAQLEDERKVDIEARRKALAGKGGPTPTDGNPVLQQFKIALAESEANVASAKAKLAGLETQYRALKSQAQLVPQIENEYTQLTRDYDVQRQTYQSLLSRRESALMGKDVQDTGGAQFRVIDPPRVSPEPVAPRRLTLLGIACALAWALGLVAAFVASQIMPTVHDARSLREVSKRPILGMVTLLPSQAETRRRRRSGALFAGALSGLIATFMAIFAFALLIGRAA